MMMRAFQKILPLFLLAILVAWPGQASALRSFALRYSNNVEGDLVMTGNMLVHCSGSGTDCTAAKTGSSTTASNRNLTMELVDADSDASTTNSSGAYLDIPSGSTVLYAGLYWHGQSTNTARSQALLRTPTGFGYSVVSASTLDTDTATGTSQPYQAYADVTSRVAAGGAGTYWVANVQTNAGTTSDPNFPVSGFESGWSLVVVFSNSSYPLRNFAVYDGYQYTQAGAINITVSGFLTPLSGPIVTRLGSVVYDGDVDGIGDRLQFNGTDLTDALHTANNAFQGLITDLGVRMSGRVPSYNNTLGYDLARWSVPATLMANGATSATISVVAPTGSNPPDYLWPGVLTFATDIYVPIITPNIVKTATDVNGGQLVAGDVLRWTVTMSNTGLDTATNLTVTDPLPAEVTYVPGTLKITAGAATGATVGTKTDAASDDVAEYISGSKSVVFRLGDAATASTGGKLAYGETATFTFDTTVNSGLAAGTPITNTVTVSYRGQTIGETYGGSGAAASAVVLGPATIAKSFSPSSIDVGGVSTLSIVVGNPAANQYALTGVTFSDNYPSGLLNAASPNAVITCTPGSSAGTLTGGAANGSSVGMSGASIAPNGNCTVTINVTSPSTGTYSNTTSTVTSTNGGAGPAATAAVLAVGKPAIAKAFSPTSILSGANSTITFTLSNPTAAARTGVAFSDTLSNMVVSTPSVTGGTCTGTRAAVAGSSSISFASGTLAASGSCTVTVSVTSTTGGVHANTSTGVSSTETGSAGNPSNTAYLTVVAAPVLTKSFSPTSVQLNVPSQLTITLSNPNTTTTVTGAAFTDTYPSGMRNDTPANSTLNCTTGSTATLSGGASGGTTIGITGASLPPGASCTLTVNVESPTTTGNLVNSTGTVTTTNAGTGTAASATLNITTLTAPTVTKAFAATTIAAKAATTLTISFTNTNTTAISSLAFNDVFPFGLAVAGTPAISNTCGGSATATAGGNALSLSGGTIPAKVGGTNGSCAVSVSVTSDTGGTYVNSTGTVTTGNAGTFGPASATLSVYEPPVITKAFSPSAIALTGTSTMTITLTAPLNNPGSLTGVGFTDNYTTGGTVLSSGAAADFMRNNAAGSTTCSGGTLTAASNGSVATLSGATLAAGASCTVTVVIKRKDTSVTANSYVNETGAVTSTNGGTGLTAKATLSFAQPNISKSFSAGNTLASPILAGASSTMSIVLTSPAGAMTNAGFTDTYPATTGMVNAATPGASSSNCGSPTITAVAGGGSITVSGASIPASGSCTITVSVTANDTSLNTIPVGALTATLSGSTASNGTAASATLYVRPRPQVTKVFSPAVITPGSSSVMTITLTNPNSTAATGVAFTDTYPSGLINFTPAGAASTCTTPTLTAANGGSSLALSGAGIPANSSCTVTVNVTSNTADDYTNTVNTVTTTNIGSSLSASGTLSVMALPTLAKSFSPAAVLVNEESILTITLNNSNAVDVTGATLTDTYPSGLVNAATPNASTSCADGTLTATAAGNSVALAGATIPAGGSCTISIRVKSAAAGSYANSTGTMTSTNAGTALAASATLTVTLPQPALSLMKLVSVLSDPVNGGTFPKSIPGAISTYTLRITNSGPGTVDANPAAPTTPTFVVSDPLPAQVDLYVGDIGTAGSGPYVFSNGSPSSGLTCPFTALTSTTDCVEFSVDGSNWAPTVTPDVNGFDSSIRYIRFRPSGSMSGASGGNPYAEFQFRVRVK